MLSDRLEKTGSAGRQNKKTPRTKSYGLFGVKCRNDAYAVPLH